MDWIGLSMVDQGIGYNFNVVLVEPEIPTNTGNIGRTCVGMCCRLHLVKPLGFEISDRRLKRAGLDYWPELDVKVYENFAEWQGQVPDQDRIFYFSTKAERSIYEPDFRPGDWFVFGKETKGLPEDLVLSVGSQAVKIPFPGKIRSYNLSNAVAMSVGEGMRQLHHSR